MPAIGRRYR